MSEIKNPLPFTDQHKRIFEIFFPYAYARTESAFITNQRFVYYTSAETAMHILRNNEVWMRKSSMMNDYSEVEHGFECLNAAYKSNRERFVSIFDGRFPGFSSRLEERFNSWLPHFRSDSYITCVSEHDPSEDRYGRLSMWRAYGGPAGVAIVLHGGPFFRPSDALKAHSSPVAYLNDQEFQGSFSEMLDAAERSGEFFTAIGEELVFHNVFSSFRSAIMCTKHPGFREEREWRIMYNPSFEPSDRLTREIVSINVRPQAVCKLPLNIPEEGLTGLNVSDLIDRIIIGPTKYPVGVFDALVSLLRDHGVQDPYSKIVVSDLPLRQ